MNIKYSQDIDTVKIMIFIVNINVVLLVALKEGQFYSFSHQHNCFQLRSHKKGTHSIQFSLFV